MLINYRALIFDIVRLVAMLHLTQQGDDITCKSSLRTHPYPIMCIVLTIPYRLPNASRHVDLHRGRCRYHCSMPAKPPTAVQDRRPWLLVTAPISQPWILKGPFEQRQHRYYELEWEQESAKGTC